MATPPTAEFLARMTNVFIRLNDDNEGTRQSALAGLRGMLSTADVDPRELTILHSGTGEGAWPPRFEDEWDKRERELRDRWAVMYPEAHKMRAHIDLLEAENKTLKKQTASIKKAEAAIDKAEEHLREAREEARRHVQENRRLQKELEAMKLRGDKDDPWMTRMLKGTLEQLAGPYYRSPMLESEMYERIAAAFPGKDLHEFFSDMGFRAGLPPSHLPIWFVVFLRSMKPPPVVTPRKQKTRKTKTSGAVDEVEDDDFDHTQE